MPRFFIDTDPQTSAILGGEDGRHIARSLRMQPGEEVTLCNGRGLDFRCEITAISGDAVTVAVRETLPSRGEPALRVTVYQGLPKSDKMDFIAQKIVETGAAALVPTMTQRCVSRPDEKAAAKKRDRWQKIAEEAAKQCGRGRIPPVLPLTDFATAIRQAAQQGDVLLCYEGGGEPLRQLISPEQAQLSIFIGPEGGFSPEEVALAQQHGARMASLGARILRTETAPIVAMTAVLLLHGDF